VAVACISTARTRQHTGPTGVNETAQAPRLIPGSPTVDGALPSVPARLPTSRLGHPPLTGRPTAGSPFGGGPVGERLRHAPQPAVMRKSGTHERTAAPDDKNHSGVVHGSRLGSAARDPGYRLSGQVPDRPTVTGVALRCSRDLSSFDRGSRVRVERNRSVGES
jgi:hypothetical protein